MSIPPEHLLPSRSILPKIILWIGWAVILGAIAYFVVRNVSRYFIFTPGSYGAQYWPRAPWLFSHVACGLLALLIGPLQFWPRIRRDYLQFHRYSGRVYVIAVFIGSVAAFGLAMTSKANLAFTLGLGGLGVAWITTTAMAYIAIRNRNVSQHRQWMVRSYVVTFAFITFRLGVDFFKATNFLPSPAREAVMAWGCWAIPLLVTEVVLQAGAVFTRK